jgi:hypothetical protein
MTMLSPMGASNIEIEADVTNIEIIVPGGVVARI